MADADVTIPVGIHGIFRPAGARVASREAGADVVAVDSVGEVGGEPEVAPQVRPVAVALQRLPARGTAAAEPQVGDPAVDSKVRRIAVDALDGWRTYDAFGVPLAVTGSTVNAFWYSGEQLYANVGFYYLRARYMTPGIGRFTTADPWPGNVHDPVLLHKYLYANANPLTFTDPSGMLPFAAVFAKALVISILASFAWVGLTWLVSRGWEPIEWRGLLLLGKKAEEVTRMGGGVGLAKLSSEGCRGDTWMPGKWKVQGEFLLLLFGYSLGLEGSIGGVGPIELSTPGLFGPSTTTLVGPAFLGAASFSVFVGRSWAWLNMGMGTGRTGFLGDWWFGWDIGFDVLSGLSIPLSSRQWKCE